MAITRRNLIGAAAAAPSFSSALAQDPDGYPRLLLGPMAGPPDPDALRIWVMASGPMPLSLELSDNPYFRNSKTTRPVNLPADTQYCGVLTATRLTPNTSYYYRVLVDGAPDRYIGDLAPPKLRTSPRGGDESRFTLAFGSCARIQRDAVQNIWPALHNRRPDLFLWLGDNIYADTLERRIMELEYERQRGVASFRPFGAATPQLAIWDDHDFALNNHDRTNPVKDMAFDVFKQFWANPTYGLSDAPGVFFKYAYGATELFCLDGRMYRDPNKAPDGPGKTMLGRAQLAWLKDELRASRAVFKILACGSGWTKAKGAGGDSWSSFIAERDALFDFIRDERIDGVVLISGDTHCGELNAIPRADQGGYDLYDLVSSPLAQPATLSWLHRTPEQRIRVPYSASANAGLLSVAYAPEPTLTYNLLTPSGQTPWAPLTLRLDDLRNGASTSRKYQDKALKP